MVGEFAQKKQVAAILKSQTVLQGQPISGVNLFFNSF
jgi:hypothetical protein